MISKEKIILLINLTNSLDETFKELEKAQDSNDYLRFNILKKDLAKIQQEISQTLGKPKTT
ncbi:hypothetical protein J4465_02775 [Candidatus Pacearchaeota archaeon]|nr:hypothetical protein [Candidatus Pacearchaeota archaeon]